MVVVFVVVGGVWEYCLSILECCGLILGVGRELGRGRACAHCWAAARAHARPAVAPKIRVAFFLTSHFFFCKCNVKIL